MPHAIVMKLDKNLGNPQCGYVRPIILEIEGEKPKESTQSDFPNRNSIFITSQYEECIDDRFSDGDIFRISFEENRHVSASLDQSSPNFCYYVARGMDAMPLSRDEYFHVIKAVVTPNNRFVTLPIKPKRYVITYDVLNNQFNGPFDYEEPQLDPTLGGFKTQLKPLQYISGLSIDTQWYSLKFKADPKTFLNFFTQSISLLSIADLISLKYEVIDFILDDQLIKWANECINTTALKLSKKDTAIP